MLLLIAITSLKPFWFTKKSLCHFPRESFKSNHFYHYSFRRTCKVVPCGWFQWTNTQFSSRTTEVEGGGRPCASCRKQAGVCYRWKPCTFVSLRHQGKGPWSIYLFCGNLSDVLHLLCCRRCGAPLWWLSAYLRQQTCLYFLALISPWYLNEAFLVPSKLRILLALSHKMALLLPSLSGEEWGRPTLESTLIPLVTVWLGAKEPSKLTRTNAVCKRGPSLVCAISFNLSRCLKLARTW